MGLQSYVVTRSGGYGSITDRCVVRAQSWLDAVEAYCVSMGYKLDSRSGSAFDTKFWRAVDSDGTVVTLGVRRTS